MPDLDELIETQADLSLDDGDHDRYAHYVRKDEMMAGYVEGKPVIALCGKIWVPNRDPKKFPMCPSCKEIFDALFLSE
jgi:hypothetical protein